MTEAEQGDDFDPLLKILRPIVAADSDVLPTHIKRYRIQRRIGSGAFGEVFLAQDGQLQRNVAIKVPRRSLMTHQKQIDRYLNEARMIAGLDHPNIVPVFDVGSTYDFPCFIVTKYIDGSNLQELNRKQPMSAIDAIELTINVAEALHFAHTKGIVHRDIKPANILIDKAGKPFVADLGLALRNDAPSPRGMVGTPAYMSPEQARGESHRVDGRSDIFSLGVVLFELLSGQLPYSAKSSTKFSKANASQSPQRLGSLCDFIPSDLEAICMKAIEPRASDRYTIANDFAQDLTDYLENCDRQWLEMCPEQNHQNHQNHSNSTRRVSSRLSDISRGSSESGSRASHASVAESPIIPKGLRSFDEGDRDFFLRLLPGPFDKNGVPESIRFWKARFQDDELAARAPVGFLYGPSGSGKSSLVHAGIVPHLNDQVAVISISASRTNTEEDLLNAIHAEYSQLSEETSLAKATLALRGEPFAASEKKTLLIIDQFEQWLSGSSADSTLTQALRHCDGVNLQCLILVRDEFWLSLTRFSRDLEVSLIQGDNLAAVDLFHKDHARQVLHLLGNAYGKLPKNTVDLTPTQNQFLDQIIDQLSNNERVASIQLAMLAQSLSTQEWNSKDLQSQNGLYATAFRMLRRGLEDSPRGKQHIAAACRLLSELLPPEGGVLKGAAKPKEKLQIASGLEYRESSFEDLLDLLENQLQLISPIDSGTGSNELNYQITHDYLVPAIKKWTSEIQAKTSAGRSRRQLKDRAKLWAANPSRQRLPGPAETLRLSWYCRAANNSPLENRMLTEARKQLFSRSCVLLLFLAATTIIAFSWVNQAKHQTNALIQTQKVEQARSFVDSFESTPMTLLPALIEKLNPLEAEVVPMLRERLAEAASLSDKRIYLGTLAKFDKSLLPDLIDLAVDATDQELQILAAPLLDSQSFPALAKIEKASESADSDRIKANLAWLALGIGDPHLCEQALVIDSTPNDRSQIIVRAKAWPQNWPVVIQKLEMTDSLGTISGFLLSASQTDPEKIDLASRQRLIRFATLTFQHHPSAIVHSSCKKLLTEWNQPIPDAKGVAENTQWHKTVNELTMLKVPVALGDGKLRSFTLDTVPVEKYSLGNDFWLSDQEIPGELFKRFLADASLSQENQVKNWDRFRSKWNKEIPQDTRTEETTNSPRKYPIRYVSLLDAIKFCNWLSTQEGLEPAYEFTGRKLVSGAIPRDRRDEFFHEFVLKPEKTGYRLPAMSQWQFARLGNSKSKFACGTDLELVRDFGVWSPATPQSTTTEFAHCGSKLPNNFGLFDMEGNTSELVHSMQLKLQEYTGADGKKYEDFDYSNQYYFSLWCGNGSSLWANANTHADLISFESKRVGVLVDRSSNHGFRVALPANWNRTPDKSTNSNE